MNTEPDFRRLIVVSNRLPVSLSNTDGQWAH